MLKELEMMASKLNEERAQLMKLLESISEDDATKTLVTEQWSIKDELAHLAGAERGMLGIGKRAAGGEHPHLPEGYNNDEYNARQVAKRRQLPIAELRAELQTTRQELLDFMNALTLEQLNLIGEHPLEGEVAVKDLCVIIYNHETAHYREIAAKVRELRK